MGQNNTLIVIISASNPGLFSFFLSQGFVKTRESLFKILKNIQFNFKFQRKNGEPLVSPGQYTRSEYRANWPSKYEVRTSGASTDWPLFVCSAPAVEQQLCGWRDGPSGSSARATGWETNWILHTIGAHQI